MDKRDEVNKHAPIESSLIWTVIKHLQELTPPQMEHKLRINTKIIRQPKARWVLLPIVRKLLTKSNQHPIQPPQHIWRIINLSFEHRDPSHEDSSSFLIE
jgi:hypothetical protein